MTPRKSAKSAKPGADDLDVLHPEREAVIAGKPIVMREYGFVEGMRLHARATPVVDAIAASASADLRVTLAALQVVFAEHTDVVAALIAQACDQPLQWVTELNDADGQALLGLWWSVNAGFFVRRVVQKVQVESMLKASPGASSTPPSSPTATTRPGSASTPAVN